MSPLDKSIVRSPLWLLALGGTALLLLSPRPENVVLAAGFIVTQAVLGIFLIAFPFVQRARLRRANP